VGDDKKKGGSKGGTFKKLLLLAVLALVGAEVFAQMTSNYEWSPWTRARQFIKQR
jgi:hypothetical protein